VCETDSIVAVDPKEATMSRVLTVAAAAALLFASCATSDETATDASGRRVVIYMRDNHFEPNKLDVRRGETVNFRFVNAGLSRHDAFIGDRDEQADHEREMRMTEDAEHGGHMAEEMGAITVEAGKTGRLSYRFAKGGRTLIGCHEPGHYKAGMIVSVTVD
jgi:uncharacterized cupredoxin-like copper-binding protein